MFYLVAIFLFTLTSFGAEIDTQILLDSTNETDFEIGHVTLQMLPEQPAQAPVSLTNPNQEIISTEVFYGDLETEESRQWLRNYINQGHADVSFQFASSTDNNAPTPDILRELAGSHPIDTIKITPQDSEGNNRAPDSVSMRLIWSLITGVTAGGSTYMTFTIAYSDDLTQEDLFKVSLAPGMMMFLFMYYSGQYENWLSNGKWALAFLESTNPTIRSLRNNLGLTSQQILDHLVANEESITRLVPELAETPEVFNTNYRNLRGEALDNHLSSRLKTLRRYVKFEEYVKSYFIEVLYTQFIYRFPQSLIGLNDDTSVFASAFFGVLSEAPFDLAIMQRKFQKIVELRDSVLSGRIQVENQELLLTQINRVLSKTDDYVIGNSTHILLRNIENWSRSRSTLLTFMSTIGQTLDVAGVHFISRPMLLGLSATGGFYYVHVNGVFQNAIQNNRFINQLMGRLNPRRRGYVMNYCRSLFL